MGIMDAFKGYLFVKFLVGGLVLNVAGIILLGSAIRNNRLDGFAISAFLFLIGFGLLYMAHKIWSSEKDDTTISTSSVGIGYSKEPKLKECPECGEKKMDVEFDGSGICNGCGYSTQDYDSEMSSN
ncbi:MAG: hypothetical protein ACOCT7_01215 [Candidatus Saliniplasma sp.]